MTDSQHSLRSAGVDFLPIRLKQAVVRFAVADYNQTTRNNQTLESSDSLGQNELEFTSFYTMYRNRRSSNLLRPQTENHG